MNDQPTLFDTGNTLVDSLFRRARVLESEGQIEKRLSPRELQIMRLISEDWQYGKIACSFGCTTRTVITHVRRVRAKLDCHSNAAAIAILIRKGDI